MTQLQSRLQTAEKRISDLEHDKIAAVVSAEQAASIKIVNMQVRCRFKLLIFKTCTSLYYLQLKHKKDIDVINRKLEEALATITAQEQRIQILQPEPSTSVMWKHMNTEGKMKLKVSPKQKGNPLQHKNPEEDDKSSQNPNHCLVLPSQCTSGTLNPSYFGGRWTAHRADYKKVSIDSVVLQCDYEYCYQDLP